MPYLEAEEDAAGQGATILADGIVVGRIVADDGGGVRIDAAGLTDGLAPIVGASPRDAWNHLLGAVRAGHLQGVIVGAFRDAADPSD